MGLLKEEPSLLYMYEYIKVDKTKIKTPKVVLRKDDVTHRLEESEEWNIGDMIYTTDTSMDKRYYKFVATCRRAFIGDMQERLDKAYQCNNMERYAKADRNLPLTYAKVTLLPIKRSYTLRGFWTYITSFFKKKEIHDFYLEDLLFNKENEPRVFFNKKDDI